jgi:P-type Cu+ transporter
MKKQFTVKGMHCVSCASAIEKKVWQLDGVESCDVNYTNASAAIAYDTAKVGEQDIAHVVKDLGYTLSSSSHTMPDGSVMSDEDHSMHTWIGLSQEEKIAQIQAMKRKIYVTMPMVMISFVYMWWDIAMLQWWRWITMPSSVSTFFHHLFPVMATYVMFGVWLPYLRGIWTFIKHRVATMDTLIGIGTLTAYVYSFAVGAFKPLLENYIDVSAHYFDVTIVVIGLVYLGKYLEEKSKLHTGDAISKLLQLQAKTAIVEEDGQEKEVAVDLLIVWQIVIVKPWMKIPVDGKIVSGRTSIDESMISGESLPIDKDEWDAVIGGTVNIHGYIKVAITALWSSSVLSRIVKMVQEAQSSKAPIQKLVDKISSMFVPVVLVVALLAFIFWIIFGSLPTALVTGIGVLIIACPCALGLATPMGIVVWVGKGAERGILIKNAEVLQKLQKVWTVVFDKTGTITNGKPEVVNVWGDEKLLPIVYAIENQSEHPLAQSIVRYASSSVDATTKVTDFEALGGKGVQAVLAKKTWHIGNRKLMEEQGIVDFPSLYDTRSKEGKTVVFVAADGIVHMLFAIADTIKKEAKDAIYQLHRMGIQSVMITWDHSDVAMHIAHEVGIDQVFAEVLPEDKAWHIVRLQQSSHKKIAMAGDGINDAPALAQADVGIAMSTGTDVAIETADITLLYGDITKIAQAIRLSQQTMTTIKQNLFWAFIYNIIGIPLAAGLFYPFLLNPVFAGAAMAFSSVSVVLNSLRLKMKRL